MFSNRYTSAVYEEERYSFIIIKFVLFDSCRLIHQYIRPIFTERLRVDTLLGVRRPMLITCTPIQSAIAVLQQVSRCLRSSVRQFSILMKIIIITPVAWSYGINLNSCGRQISLHKHISFSAASFIWTFKSNAFYQHCLLYHIHCLCVYIHHMHKNKQQDFFIRGMWLYCYFLWEDRNDLAMVSQMCVKT